MHASWYLTKRRGIEKELGGEARRGLFVKLIDSFKVSWNTEDASWYKKRFEQYYKNMVIGHNAHQCFQVRTSSPILIGNGSKSVLESHITLHQTYGIPYIPGTAIKGMTAYFCDRIIGEQDPKYKSGDDIYDNLFGTQDQKGYISFYDALMEPESVATSLQLDVLTPHHQAYNQSSAIHVQAPRDDDSPEPISFLSAQGSFLIMLACEGNDGNSQKWLNLACMLVKQALISEGIGGKTNAGYGRFNVQ